jgi:hypothetical protein
MISLIYVSIASHPMNNQESLELLNQCVRNNQPAQITGMLLYKDGKFMQILEGPDDAVRKIYAAIEHDDRHYSIIKLVEGPSVERLFPKWTMGFRDLDAIRADEVPGYEGFLNEDPVGQVFPLEPDRAEKLLRMFRPS